MELAISGYLGQKCVARESVQQFLSKEDEYSMRGGPDRRQKDQSQQLLGVRDPLAFVRTRKPQAAFAQNTRWSDQQALQAYQFNVNTYLQQVSVETNNFLSDIYAKTSRARDKHAPSAHPDAYAMGASGNLMASAKLQNQQVEFSQTKSVYYQGGGGGGGSGSGGVAPQQQPEQQYVYSAVINSNQTRQPTNQPAQAGGYYQQPDQQQQQQQNYQHPTQSLIGNALQGISNFIKAPFSSQK